MGSIFNNLLSTQCLVAGFDGGRSSLTSSPFNPEKHPGKKRGPTGDESSPTSTMLSFRYVSYEPGKGIIFVWTNLINTHQLQLNDPPSIYSISVLRYIPMKHVDDMTGFMQPILVVKSHSVTLLVA